MYVSRLTSFSSSYSCFLKCIRVLSWNPCCCLPSWSERGSTALRDEVHEWMWLLFVRRVFSSLRNPLWSALFLCSSSHENACPSPCSCPVRGAAACSITDGVWDNGFWSCTIFLPTSLLLTPLPFHAYQKHHVCSCRWCHIKDGNFFGLFCWEEVMQACKYLNSEPWIFPHWFHELSTRDPGTLSLYSYHTCWLGQSMSCGHGNAPKVPTQVESLVFWKPATIFV